MSQENKDSIRKANELSNAISNLILSTALKWRISGMSERIIHISLCAAIGSILATWYNATKESFGEAAAKERLFSIMHVVMLNPKNVSQATKIFEDG